MTNEDQTVADVGEFALIDRLQDQLGASAVPPPRTLGIGDDAALWTPSPGTDAVVSTDALVDGVHFRLDWTDWRSLGHKALAVNLSDIAAMGARPVLATISLGLTGDERVSDLEAMYQGLGSLAEPHRVLIAGGDIVRSPACLWIGVTVIGEVAPARSLLRSGARAGNLIGVSGTLGASAAGMALLNDPPLARRSTTADLLIAAHLRPNPRLAFGAMLHDAGATAAMDLSDGLLGDLPKLLAASRVGGEITSDALPVIPAVRALFPNQWREMALRGGEDYELLFTVPPGRWADVERAAETVGGTVATIGVVGGAGLLVDDVAVDSSGWDHFRASAR